MLYLKYVAMNYKKSLEYKKSFIYVCISRILIMFGEILAIFSLFDRFVTIGGYGFYEAMICYAITMMVFPSVEAVFRGFDQFDVLIVRGDLDRFLTRPKSVFFQTLCSETEFSRFTSVLAGLGILIFSLIKLQIQLSFAKILCLLLMFLSGSVIFFGIMLIYASVCVFTVKGLEVLNVITNGGRELSQYPIDIYKRWFRNLFTFVIPFGCYNFLPLGYVLGSTGASFWGNFMAPIYGMLFLIPCLLLFKWSLTKYKSTGT